MPARGFTHESSIMLTDTWLTPPDVIDALGPFDLDPCAAPEPRPWPTAREHITLPEDGLAANWHGRVWANPPYGRDTWRWLLRLADHGRGTALVFARTETAGFTEAVWGRASAVLFLTGRLRFCRADGSQPRTPASAPSALVAYGRDDARCLLNSGLAGAFTCDWSVSGRSALKVAA